MNESRKTYYSISEVCAQTGLEPHVLRYWESEFPQLHPKKNRAGNRAYRDRDIEIIRYIQYLLYEEQYTIPGAKKKCAAHLKGQNAPAPSAESPPVATTLREELLAQLRELLGVVQPAK